MSMRKGDIRVGYTYANAKGDRREVISDEFTLAWPNQSNRDIVQYEKPGCVSKKPGSMTRTAFAKWADKCLGLTSELRRLNR